MKNESELLKACKALDAYWLESFPEGPDENGIPNDELLALVKARLAPSTILIWKQIREAIKNAESDMPDVNAKYPNGAPMWAKDGTMLDENGNRSIFDDIDD